MSINKNRFGIRIIRFQFSGQISHRSTTRSADRVRRRRDRGPQNACTASDRRVLIAGRASAARAVPCRREDNARASAGVEGTNLDGTDRRRAQSGGFSGKRRGGRKRLYRDTRSIHTHTHIYIKTENSRRIRPREWRVRQVRFRVLCPLCPLTLFRGCGRADERINFRAAAHDRAVVSAGRLRRRRR